MWVAYKNSYQIQEFRILFTVIWWFAAGSQHFRFYGPFSILKWNFPDNNIYQHVYSILAAI